MGTKYSFKTFLSTDSLPEQWHALASKNIFLSKHYLQVLESSAPTNMSCTFVGVYNGEELIGIALAQLLVLKNVRSFGQRDNCLKTKIRTFAFKRFSSNVLILGNNMLTGQNAYVLADHADIQLAVEALSDALAHIAGRSAKNGIAVHLTIWKDFAQDEITNFNTDRFSDYFRFSTQPNMVFEIRESWKSAEGYYNDLIKKYRDQYKRSRKRAADVTKRKMTLAEIGANKPIINELYLNVAQNAPFNTFYLHPDHFFDLKKRLGDHFLFYGYFAGDKLIGFNTIIRHGRDIETYFLGYDEAYQRDKMLYLNMLYDMIGYAVNKGFKKIIFARTALEIKSSVGAAPQEMFGQIRHSNPIVNYFMPRLFRYFEPEVDWKLRHPFKHEESQPSSGAEESRYQAD